MNSNAAAIFIRAASIGSSRLSCHGRPRVPEPNMSRPSQANECQYATLMRSQSSIRLPSTGRSGSYALKASVPLEEELANGMGPSMSGKNG